MPVPDPKQFAELASDQGKCLMMSGREIGWHIIAVNRGHGLFAAPHGTVFNVSVRLPDILQTDATDAQRAALAGMLNPITMSLVSDIAAANVAIQPAEVSQENADRINAYFDELERARVAAGQPALW